MSSSLSTSPLEQVCSCLRQEHPGVAAFVVPSSDSHQNEYVSPADERRAWLSGFDGSAGTALVLVSECKGHLWTDGRYHTQALQQLASERWTLMKDGTPECPSLEEFLGQVSRSSEMSSKITVKILKTFQELPSGSVVGIDPFVTSWGKQR